MIVYGAILPHTPLLLPPLRRKTKGLEKTVGAMEAVSARLAEIKHETLVAASPHSENLPEKFSIQVCDEYSADFKKFGDISTVISFSPNYELIDGLQRHLRGEGSPAALLTCSPMDYGLSVPLFFAAGNRPVRLLPINQTDSGFKQHYEFGKKIGDFLAGSNERIAVIASAHLSHRLSEDAPQGFLKEGPKYDSAVREALGAQNYSRIVNMPKQLAESAEQCGLRSICILLGILSNVKHSSKILDYNPHLGVGYITAEFSI